MLNTVFDKSIFDVISIGNAHLKPQRTPIGTMFELAMAKIADYKLDDWKRYRRIPNFSTVANRERKKEYLTSFKTSVFEFFYFMRIRASYRDFAFIDEVSAKDTATFFKSYLKLAMNVNSCLENLKATLIKARNP